jgi:hypothetical protein
MLSKKESNELIISQIAEICLSDIFLQEALVKIIPDGVIDEALLGLGLAACLVFKHHVIVPPALRDTQSHKASAN